MLVDWSFEPRFVARLEFALKGAGVDRTPRSTPNRRWRKTAVPAQGPYSFRSRVGRARAAGSGDLRTSGRRRGASF
jgi:hypothetical protein